MNRECGPWHLAHGRAEIYTREQMRQLAEKYFSAYDVADIERGFGMPPR